MPARVLLALAALMAIGAAPTGPATREAVDRAKADTARLERQAAKADTVAAAARAESVALAERIRAAERMLPSAESGMRAATRTASMMRARLSDGRRPAAALVAAMTSLARRPAVFALAQPGSLADQVHLRAALAAVLPAVERQGAHLAAAVTRAEDAEAEASAARNRVLAVRRGLDRDLAVLTAREINARGRAQALSTAAAGRLEQVLGLSEQLRELDGAVLDERREAAAIRALEMLPVPRLRPGSPMPVTAAMAVYRLPVPGRLARGFGERLAGGGTAPGLAIMVSPGAVVVAPAAGRIGFAGDFRDYGPVIIIDHGRGWTSVLTGLGSIAVAAGDMVPGGGPLGRAVGGRRPVGVELRRGGQPIEPARLVTPR